MVNDPRVTSLISRLGGLYRDPLRVDRDASVLLKSSVGVHLTPGIAPLVENNGDSANCLVLQGTIAIVYRGNTYQLLVDIYLPPGYPIRPPVSYVRLTANMYLKENHAHVGSDGMVYLPYLHQWNSRTHSLIEMVVAMSSVFSADPPVFSRPAAAPAPPPPPPPAFPEPTSAESERFIQQQVEAIMAKEAEEANRAAEVARKAAKEDEERERQRSKQLAWEEQKKNQVKEQVNQKLYTHLSELAQQTEANLQADWRDQQKLTQTKQVIQEEVDFLDKTKQDLQTQIATVQSKTTEIKEWIEEAKQATTGTEVSAENVCEPVSKVHAQLLDLSAENAALTDALYFLDRGMFNGHIDCSTHLKSVRKLAKRQFLVRAHLIKINQAMQMSNGFAR